MIKIPQQAAPMGRKHRVSSDSAWPLRDWTARPLPNAKPNGKGKPPMLINDRIKALRKRENVCWEMAEVFLHAKDAHGLHDMGVEIQASNGPSANWKGYYANERP